MGSAPLMSDPLTTYFTTHSILLQADTTYSQTCPTFPVQQTIDNIWIGSISGILIGLLVGCSVSCTARGFSWLRQYSAMQFSVCFITREIRLYYWEFHCTNPFVQKSIF